MNSDILACSGKQFLNVDIYLLFYILDYDKFVDFFDFFNFIK